jgi:hypothetical protein
MLIDFDRAAPREHQDNFPEHERGRLYFKNSEAFDKTAHERAIAVLTLAIPLPAAPILNELVMAHPEVAGRPHRS